MGTTASGFGYPDVGYTGGIRLAVKNLADTSEAVISGQHAAKYFRPADSAALAALLTTYAATLLEGDLARQTDTEVTYRFNGTTWKAWESDWISYVATATNIAVGTGGSALKSHRYRYNGGDIEVDYMFILGTSGASVSGVVSFTLPVNTPAVSSAYGPIRGGGSIADASLGWYPVFHVANNTAVDSIRIQAVGATGPGNITSTFPITWAAGDAMGGNVRYTPA